MAKIVDLNARLEAKRMKEEAEQLAVGFIKEFGDQPKEFFIEINKAIQSGDKEAYMAIIRPIIEKKAFIHAMKDINKRG